jgi:hypothetical protein
VAAWSFATHCFEAFDVFPYLALTSPTPRCGKSTLLACIGQLSRSPVPAANISEAALFRTIMEDKPTLLLDEIEWLKQKSERAQILTNLLNAGHRCDAIVIRCSQDGKRQRFSVFGPKALSIIGDLAATLTDRSIHVALQRKTKHERVERFRFRAVRREADPLRARIAEVMEHAKSAVAHAYQSLPDLTFLDDRAADNWAPLFALVGVLDPSRLAELRTCATVLSTSRSDMADDSLPLRVLSDFAAVAAERVEKVIPTDQLIDGAKKQPESPWDEVDLTPRKAAKWLRGFGIKPGRVESYRGYDRKALLEAASRYLTVYPSFPSEASAVSSEKT